MALDGFSMRPLAMELERALLGGRIDRITQPSRHAVVLAVRQPGQNHLLQLSIHPQNPAMHLLSRPLENPPEPPVFCMVLRKHLEGGRIAAIRQHGLDRLLLLDIDTIAAGGSIVTRTLAAELMGKYSNLVLLEDGRIVDALRKIGSNSSRVRTVLPGQDYELPPPQDKLDVFSAPMDGILARIRSDPSKKLSKAILDACMGFGPVSAREAAFAAGLSGDRLAGELEPVDLAALGDAIASLRDDCREHPAPCLLLGENRKLLAMAAFPLQHVQAEETLHPGSMSRLLEMAGEILGSYVLPDKDRFRKLVKNELGRASRKSEALAQEIADAENAEIWRIRADNLMTYMHQFHDHAGSEITVPDIYSEEGAPIAIPLDPRLTLRQNMQAHYKKYDKLKRAKALLREQLRICEAEALYLASIEASLETCSSFAELGEIHDELVAGGYLREKPRKKSQDKPARPFRFRAPDGTEILVGKNNSQNDRLTFRTAAHNDLWLHAKDIPGSHVILRCGGGGASEETLLLAARLAAYFSKARDSANVPVDCTECRYVKKPSGAKPGFVVFTHQSTLYVTPDKSMENLVVP